MVGVFVSCGVVVLLFVSCVVVVLFVSCGVVVVFGVAKFRGEGIFREIGGGSWLGGSGSSSRSRLQNTSSCICR